MKKKSLRNKTRLLLTDRSLNDIAAIENYSMIQWGKKATVKYIAQIEDALLLIKNNTDLLRIEENLHSSLRFYSIKKHLLVFDHQDNNLILLTVFHSSMDIASRLTELQPTLATEIELFRRRL